MNDNNLGQHSEKLSMGLSVFIALCVVGLFCAISIVIIEGLSSHSTKTTNSSKHVNLPSNKDLADFVI